LSQIVAFNEKLKELVEEAKQYEATKNLKKAIKTWIEISDLCLKFAKKPDIDISFKNMITKKTRNIINHVKSLKQTVSQKERRWIAKEEEEISDFFHNLPETPSDVPEIYDSSGTKDGDMASSDQKIRRRPDTQNLPDGFKEIKAKDYDFDTIIPQDESKVISKDQGETADSKTPTSQTVPKHKKIGRPCPFCGANIGENDKVCSHCGTPI
jgi:hypothetical protein